MKDLKTIYIIHMLLLTILLIHDYFSILPIAHAIARWVLVGLIITMFLSGNLFSRFRRPTSLTIFKWEALRLLYFIFLLGILTVLGGQSTTGIAFDNGFIWIVILLSLIELFTTYQEVNQNGL